MSRRIRLMFLGALGTALGLGILLCNSILGSAYFAALFIILFHKSQWIRPLKSGLAAFMLLLFLLLALTQYLASDSASTYAAIRLLGLKQVTDAPPYLVEAKEPPVFDELKDLRDEFHKDLVKEGHYTTVVEDADKFSHSAREVLIALRQKNDSGDLPSLSNAIAGLDKAMDSHGFQSLVDVRKKVAAWKEHIETAHSAISAATSLPAARDLTNDFYIRSRDTKFAEVYEKVSAVQSALNAVVKINLSSNVQGEISLEENATCGNSTGEVVFDEVITLRLEHGTMRHLNLSNLVLGAKYRGYKQQILLAYEPTARPALIQDPARIDLKSGTQSVVVYNRMEDCGRVNFSPGLSWLRLGSIRSFLIRWPEPYPTKIELGLDLSGLGLPRDYPVILDIKEEFPIKKIFLPANAFLSASETFPLPHRFQSTEVIEPNDLSPSFFKTHSYIWVEYLPSYLRWSTLQDYKTYLFSENLVGALLFSVLGVIAGLLVKWN